MFQNESDPNFQPNPEPQPQPEPQRPFHLPPHNQEVVRVILLGDYGGIINTIHQFAAKGLATPINGAPWSPQADRVNTSPSTPAAAPPALTANLL